MSQRLNYKIYGEEHSKTIIILHGVFGMLDNWHLAAKALSETHKVVTYDARNHGKSFHDNDCSYQAMSDDLLNLMEELNIENAFILAHSMGGKTAMLFADQHPQKVIKLIPVDIAPKAYHAGHLEYIQAFKSIDFSKIQSRKEADDAFLPYAPILGVRQFLLKNLEVNPSGGYQLKININAIENHYYDIIGGLNFQNVFNGETHFILGEKSGYLKESDKPYIEQHFPHSDYHTISKAGHWVHADNPEEFLQVVKAIID